MIRAAYITSNILLHSRCERYLKLGPLSLIVFKAFAAENGLLIVAEGMWNPVIQIHSSPNSLYKYFKYNNPFNIISIWIIC